MGAKEVCDKHDDCLGSIHDKINGMQLSSSQVMGEMTNFIFEMREFRKGVSKDLYDPQTGMTQKIASHGTQLTLQWYVIGTFVGGIIIGLAITYFRG